MKIINKIVSCILTVMWFAANFTFGVYAETEKNTSILINFFPREARFCFRERHDCTFARVTAVPLGNEKNMFFVFLFLSPVTVLLS